MSLGRLRWVILILLSASTTINYIDRQSLSVLLPILRDHLNLSSSDYGTITTLFLVAYTISQFFSGVLIDKIGTRKGFSFSICVWAASSMAHAFSIGTATLSVFRFFLGIGEAGNWPAGGKAIARWFPRDRRAFAMGFFDAGSALGAIIAPPMVALLAIHLSWRSVFVTTGTLGFLWFACWLWIYDKPETHRWLSDEDRRRVLEEGAAAGNAGKNTFGGALSEIIKMRQLWGLVATRVAATPVWWFYVFWLPDYLARCRGFSLAEIGLFAWTPYLTVDLGKMVGGAASDFLLKKGYSTSVARKSVMLAGAVCMAGGALVYSSTAAWQAIFWVCVATFGFGGWSANILAIHADIFSADKMGSALGLTGMGASLGGAASTFLIGRAVDSCGYEPVFFFAGGAALVACLALFFWVGKIDPKPAQSELASQPK